MSRDVTKSQLLTNFMESLPHARIALENKDME